MLYLYFTLAILPFDGVAWDASHVFQKAESNVGGWKFDLIHSCCILAIIKACKRGI